MRTLWTVLISLGLLVTAASATGCGNPPTCGTCPGGQACVHQNNGVDRCAVICGPSSPGGGGDAGGDGGVACPIGQNCQPGVLVPPPPPGVMVFTNPDNNTVYACVPQ